MAIYYYPNCTLPSTTVSYVGSPNIRGTLDILWSSLATIVACTYTVLHLNVPEQRRGRDSGLKGDVKWGAKRLLNSIKWALITIVVPEFILSQSLHNYTNARRQLKKLHGEFPETRQTWRMIHMLFADMGGFVLRYRYVDSETEAPPVTSPSTDKSDTVSEPVDDEERAQPDDAPSFLWHLDAYTLCSAVVEGLLPTDIVTTEEISDKSKSDLLGKVLAILQITYFLVGVIERAAQDLAVSQLELGVVGFVACSIITYLFNISKPKNVCTAIVIKDYESESLPRRFKELGADGRDTLFSSERLNGLHIANDTYYSTGTVFFNLAGSSTLLGAIHIAGWNFEFPSLADTWIWRVSALTSATVLLLLLAMLFLLGITEDEGKLEKVAMASMVVVIASYCLSRLALIVEMFRCLCYASPDTFIASATMNIPHFG